jgi:4-aminobutyrate aminotransferase/(S)-3-amino-2-methylpropionate transaminase
MMRRFSTKITDSLMARRAAATPKALSATHPGLVMACTRSQPDSCLVFVQSAKNTELFDVDGKRYLDFAGGISVMNVGHVSVLQVNTRTL